MNLQKTRIPVKSKLEYRVAKGTSRLSERKLERKEALYVTEQLIALLQVNLKSKTTIAKMWNAEFHGMHDRADVSDEKYPELCINRM